MTNFSISTPSIIALLVALASPVQLAMGQTLSGSAGSQDQRENAVNVDWTYNWGINPKHDVSQANFEFVPMIWSATTAGNGLQTQINQVLDLESNYGIKVNYLLGFNEPELTDQANMTVQKALDSWDVITNAFENTDIKLVSPAVSGTSARVLDEWLYPFMDEVVARNADADPTNDLKVDAIAYHFYTPAYNPQAEATKLLNAIDTIWNKYQLPIWLTEFAGTSFSLDNPVHSVEERTAFNAEFLETLIPEFESREYLERYAWWQFGALGQPYSALSTSSGGIFTPTELGEIYSGTTLQSGQTHDFADGDSRPTDVHYLKGGTLTNTGSELSTALRAIDAMEGDSILGGTSDFGFEVAEDAFVRVRTGATLRKQGTNTITLDGTLVENSGSLRVEAGMLQLQGGVSVGGTGMLHVDGGTLSLGAVGDAAGSRVDQALQLHGGTVQANSLANGGQNTIAGSTTLQATTTFSGEGNLTATGQIDGQGGITKNGSGSLYLTGDNNYLGTTSIQDGKLFAVNDSGSATGTGAVNVMSTGTLGGYGRVGGAVTVHDGGAVAPGVSVGNRGSITLPAFEEGVVVNALDFNFQGVQDDAPLTQTSTLSPALELVSGLDFGAGLSPRGAANNGNEFNVMGFSTGTTWGDAAAANDYLTFTVDPVPGLSMLLDDVTFELRRNGAGAATHYRIFTSIDGFDQWNAGLSPLTLALDTSDTSTQIFTASYTGDEAVSGPAEVRLYGWNASSGFGNTHIYGASLDASFIADSDFFAVAPTGVLELGGDYTQLDFATLELEFAGMPSSGPDNTDHDQLLVLGDVMLEGILDLSFVDGFTWTTGQTFDIITGNSISGEFDIVMAPEGVEAVVSYLDSVVRVEFSDVIAVPEPNSLALILACSTFLFRRRKSKR
ncbi:glycosyl hydrolase [Novipirellula herctigrandis]|uniref:glycosyl hydrolase n=1 Tax=Novipirellula herctigrandis TaxID=2527986 RepID=UPI003AF3CC14